MRSVQFFESMTADELRSQAEFADENAAEQERRATVALGEANWWRCLAKMLREQAGDEPA